jgi:hypothetical protein
MLARRLLLLIIILIAFSIIMILCKWPELSAHPLVFYLQGIARNVITSTLMGFAVMIMAYVSLHSNSSLLHKAIRLGEHRQEQALVELTSCIKARVNNPELMTTHSLRALALSVEQHYRCSVITDKLIAEAIRAVAFEFEQEFRDSALVSRLRILNTALATFDSSGPPLLSVATVDRLSAYRLSQPVALGILVSLLGLLAVLNLLVDWPFVIWPTFALLLVLSTVLIIANIRAAHFWGDAESADSQSHYRFFASVLEPKKLSPLLDLFLVASLSRHARAKAFWHNLWGPVWETAITFRPHFLEMHDYRYHAAMDLKNKLFPLEQSLLRASQSDEDLNPYFAELADVYRKLWTITGDSYYKTQAHRSLSVSGQDHALILDEILKRHTYSQGELQRLLTQKRKAFFSAMSIGREVDESQIETLNSIIETAGLLWRQTQDPQYKRIELENAKILEGYQSTGKSFTDTGE